MLNYDHVSDIWAEACKEMLDPPRGEMLPWWPTVNEYLGGLRPHELTLLSAPTGAGKTQLLANIAAQMVLGKVPTFVAPVETGGVDFVIRLASCLDRMDYNTGKPIDGHTLEALTRKHCSTIIEAPLYISSYDNRVDIHEMLNNLKYMHQQYGVRLALLDNLNFFLKVVSSQLEKAEMDNAMHEFVMLVKKLPMHVILITHPKKTEGGRVTSEFDIKGSSTAVQECSNVMLFNRPTEKDVQDGKRDITEREIIFRKIRKRGVYVGRAIWLSYKDGRLTEAR